MGRNTDWQAGPSIYTIYPRSFHDTTGNGIGDIEGVIRKLDHVASLDVDAIWLCPVYASPMHDLGYDISDHRAVDPLYGTMEDFDRLVARAHELGLKVIVDCVFNHTSSDHPWFQAAINGDEEKADCYVWRDPKPDGTPPNNWISQFGLPAWTWNHRRQQYYHHQFLHSQPNLNLRNELVQTMYRETMEFWLARGVDGFRLDVVTAYLFDPDMPDNPPARPVVASKVTGPNYNPYSYQDHVYDLLPGDGAAYTENIRKWAGKDTYLIGESNTGNQSLELAKSFTAPGRLNHCYTTDPIAMGHNPVAIADFINEMNGTWSAPFWFTSHDQTRHNSSLGDGTPESAKFYAALLAAMPGAIVMFQGEELGLTQPELSRDENPDPFDQLYWPDPPGRAGPRVPIPWEPHGPGYGFTEGVPWLPMRWDRSMSVTEQEHDPASVLSFYRQVMKWRRDNGIGTPDTLEVDASPDALSLRIAAQGRTWLAVFNFSGDAALPVPTYQDRHPAIDAGWNGRMLRPFGAAIFEALAEDQAEEKGG